MLLNRQESYHKCTGVHVKALCAENTLEIVQWPKDKPGGNDWRLVVESLDPDRDVVLFPYESATPAKQFNWNKATPDSSGSFENKIDETGKWRLVVLEGAWNAGKTMAKQIVDHRNKVGLPPLHCVILTDVIGEYWRFQANGHSAVSTIEAIAHAAREAGLSPSEHKDLLLLFRLQKYRVLTNVKVGAKIPKAISVQGSGPGSWEEYTKDIVIN